MITGGTYIVCFLTLVYGFQLRQREGNPKDLPAFTLKGTIIAFYPLCHMIQMMKIMAYSKNNNMERVLRMLLVA